MQLVSLYEKKYKFYVKRKIAIWKKCRYLPLHYRQLHLSFEKVCGPQDKSTNDVGFLSGKNVTSSLI